MKNKKNVKKISSIFNQIKKDNNNSTKLHFLKSDDTFYTTL
jgi:hypothetical protein